MILTRRGLLGSGALLAGASLLGLPGLTRAAGTAKRLVLVHARGGWDVTYTLDPKLGLANIDGPDLDEDPSNPDDREDIQTFGGSAIGVNRVKRESVRTFFQNWGSQTAVLNGLWVGSIAHDPCTIRMMTGARTEASPDLAAVTGASLGTETPIPYMDLSGIGFVGPYAAYSGKTGRQNQLKLLLDREGSRIPGPGGSGVVYPQFHPSASAKTDIEAFLESRKARFSDSRARVGATDTRISDYLEAQRRAQELIKDGAFFADSLEVGRQSTLANMAETVGALFETNLCHTVAIESGSSFDTHDNNEDQHDEWETTFVGLNALMDSLDKRGLLADTVIVVVSEMTRTPKRNADGGKDHWPITSAMVIGAGVRGGATYGATDDGLDALPVNLATGVVDQTSGMRPTYAHFAAGVLELVGVEPESVLPDTEVYRAFHA